MKELKVLELFAGLGACSKALERLNIPHKIVDAVEIDKYAIKSFNAIHGTNFEPQDITTWDKDIEVDLIMHGSPCFVGDTLVLTSNGYKKIVDISIGDSVLTHNNCYHKVLNKFNQGLKEIYSIKAMSCDLVETTSNHLFYVREMYREWDNTRRTYIRKFKKPVWKECQELTKKDYLGMPINTNIILPNWNGITRIVNGKSRIFHKLDMRNETLWYLCGRYVGDGWLQDRKDRNDSLSIVKICCGKHKKDSFVEKITKDFPYTLTEERTTYKLTFSNIELAYFLEQFGRGAINKKIPGFMFDMPTEYIKCFLDGYFDADGCYTQGRWKATSISKELIYGISRLVEKVYNRPCCIYKNTQPSKHVIEGRIVNQHDTYSFTFKPTTDKQDHAFCENNYIWIPISSIKNTHKLKEVYDIEVEKSHSFTANGIAVHNCQDFSLAGKQAGGDKDSGTRSSLMYETIRIVEKLKPKYVVWENVKNLLSKKHRHNFDAYLKTMENLGYNNYYQVLNAKDYLTPQNRERIFTISIINDINKDFHFPKKQPLKLRLKDLLDKEVDEEYYLVDNYLEFTNFYTIPRGSDGKLINGSYNRVWKKEEYCGSINLTKIQEIGEKDYINNLRIRKLTPKETWRLMGFDDEDFEKAEKINLNTQLYKQAGNSIVVNVLEAIFKELFKEYLPSKDKWSDLD